MERSSSAESQGAVNTKDLKETLSELRLTSPAYTGDIPLLKLMLKAGASPDEPLYEGKRPIELAQERGRMEVVKLLQKAGATL